MEEFIACFSDVSDPRGENVRHNLYEVLMIALCTLLCGGEDCSDMELFGRAKRPFLRQFLRLKYGIPSHDTFSRVFRQLDPRPFQACFVRFMERFAQGLDGVIAVGGKTLRGSFDRASGLSPLHMVHAWAVDQRLLLGQIATDAKSNEITAVPELLAMLSLKGCIVTADAMGKAGQRFHQAQPDGMARRGCQRAICAQIVEQGGGELFRLGKPETEVGQASLPVAFEACNLHLRRRARLQFRDQLHVPNHLPHQLILVP
jgi:predicted transposase YbfD/YdcC